ncbi:MAG: GNAT family N-acetyltransferase [bacterium]|nr:GNAT family N-acetyltransferase [bacterium]
MNSLRIRDTKLEDIDQIYKMGKGAPEFTVSDSSSFWEKGDLERWVKDKGEDILLVAELENKIVGFVLAKYHKTTRLRTITNIFVKEAYRGKGIGTKLLEKTKSQLLNKGATYLYALIKKQNDPSLGLFKSAGFMEGYDMTWEEYVPK